jgi:thiol:disulfide interchange protein DsbC
MPMRLIPLVLTTFLTAFSFTAQAGEAEVKKRLGSVLPPSADYQIEPGPLKGFYKVITGLSVVYVSEDGRYLMVGDLVDLDTRVNFTEREENRLRLAKLNAIPKSELIRYPAKGKARGELYVFTDVDCPYCHKLHEEVTALNAKGVTVNYLAYPRTRPGSPSWQKSQAVWCSDKPAEQLEKAMQGQSVKAASCADPVARHQALGSQMGVNGTPAIILPSGVLLPGYGKAEEILKAMGLN